MFEPEPFCGDVSTPHAPLSQAIFKLLCDSYSESVLCFLTWLDRSTDVLQVMLFWGAYVIDRNNSLRLGRAPAIQDYDIDTPMVERNSEYHPAIISLMRFWVQCGRAQGKICTALYGPAGDTLDPQDRVRTIDALAQDLEQAYSLKSKVRKA